MKQLESSILILMADDDEDDCLLVKEAFAQNRLRNDLRFVADGEELLDYLYRRKRYSDPAAAPCPQIILLDLNMPRKDGREALREIKNNPELRRIPVVVLSTSEDQRDVSLCYDLGANSFITKPVTFSSLVQIVESLGQYWLKTVELPSNQNGC